VTACGARLTVLERKPVLAPTRDGLRVTLDPRDLEDCNKVLSTSTMLLNDTLDEVLSHCRAARVLAMIGPGASCLADPLFRRGVTLLGGVWVENPAAMRDPRANAQAWGTRTRKTALTSALYPGLDALLTGSQRPP